MLVPSIFSNNFVDDLFNDAFPFGDARAYGFPALDTRNGMSADIQEFDDHYQMDIELPGFKKENIQAELKEGYLLVAAKRESSGEEKDKKGRYLRKERYFGSFQRSFYVGDAVTQEDIKAEFEDGILKIEVPKKEAEPEMEEKHYISITG